jgi:hypothetical protein
VKDSRPAYRGPTPILALLAFFCVRNLDAQSEAPCRSDITESMGYHVRSVNLEARWVSKDLIDRLRNIVRVGGIYSPIRVSEAQKAVEDDLVSREHRSFEFGNLGAASVLVIDSCVKDVSDEQHPKQVDVVIRPHYLRVDLFHVGSNILPVPRTIEPSFYDAVPPAIRNWNPQVTFFSDRNYGAAVGLQTGTVFSASKSNDTAGRPEFRFSAEGDKSLNHSFYDISTSVAFTSQRLSGGSDPSWTLAARYDGFLRPRDDGEYLKNDGRFDAQLQLRPRNDFVDAVSFGAAVSGSSNRLEDEAGRRIAERSDIAIAARSILDSRWIGGIARLGLWCDNGFGTSGQSSYQRLAARFSFAKEFGNGHQTVGVEIGVGGGQTWGSVPEYAQFYVSNLGANFLREPIDSADLSELPAGPVIRSLGEGEGPEDNHSGRINGGQSFWNVNVSIAIPVPQLSRPLVPDIELGTSTVARKLKGAVNSARNSINEELVQEGLPDNDETTAKADSIVDRDIKPAVVFLADHANIYAVKPLLLCDVAQLNSSGHSDGDTRVGVGGGLQVTVVTAKLETGYMWGVKRERGDPHGNFFLRFVFENIF